MLASVRTLDEALFALEAGADFIDLKEPSRGALGALDHAAVRVCVKAIGGRRPVSATIGDIISMDPREMTTAVERMAATGVDYIKIGFFAHPRAFDCAKALTVLADRAQLVAVIFADEPWSMNPSPSGRGAGVRDELVALTNALADTGFTGAMLDTAHKTGKTLRDWRKDEELREFVNRARAQGLLTGLAGSLRKEDIAPLLAIEPDYLGFRGALCSGSNRNQNLDAAAFAKIRSAIPELESIVPTL
jgi:dihydroneopterin aldolase